MADEIRDYEAFDIDAHIDAEGLAVLSLVTDRGPVGVQMKRPVVEALAARIKRELERVPAPARRR